MSALLRFTTIRVPDHENKHRDRGHFLARRFSDWMAAASSGVIVMGSAMVSFQLGGDGCQLAAIVIQVMRSGVEGSSQCLRPVVSTAVKRIQHRLRGGA